MYLHVRRSSRKPKLSRQ
ncbi:hypothetical protein Godav_016465 [Gossypium davidsonii]|uniref:Uncharacterized protein n=1 Tax=Gossypium davidsonii TaxID=34287 RepID=A0A7J8RRE6_GOSDV|nr:hypothetical protein [Gossypium davidsonii]